MNKLPNKLWELLEVAIEDLKSVQRRKNVTINMDTWVEVGDDGKTCSSCMAGAVMINSLNMIKDFDFTGMSIDPTIDASEDVSNKLLAINFLREGEIQEAMDVMNIEYSNHNPLVEITSYHPVNDYHKDRKRFFQDMNDLKGYLKELDL